MTTVETPKGNIATVAERWFRQYRAHGMDLPLTCGKTWVEIHKALLDLTASASVEDVEAIMHTQSWVSVRCSICQQSNGVRAVAVFSDSDNTIRICPICLMEALEVLSGELNDEPS